MAIPLLLIYAAYVVLLLITPIASMMTAQEQGALRRTEVDLKSFEHGCPILHTAKGGSHAYACRANSAPVLSERTGARRDLDNATRAFLDLL